jgi:hypothetical protein
MQDEFYAVAFRTKVYDNLDTLQQDLDTWVDFYNLERTHTGRYCYGKTPMQTFFGIPTFSKTKAAESNLSSSLNILTL